jgi:hypothetical protein
MFHVRVLPASSALLVIWALLSGTSGALGTGKPNAPVADSSKTYPIPAQINVHSNVSVEGVLIPYDTARRVFSKDIASKYAIVQLIISNRSSTAALIVHSVFLDYSRWGLSGLSQRRQEDASVGQQLSCPGGDEPFQSCARISQVASAEYRVVRGDLLDAQKWSARNWVERSLTFAGAGLAGYEFAVGPDLGRGFGVFGSTLAPGTQVLWPDGTVDQLNRISDVGFQTDKVIPKSSSDIIVAFFPISRFLTPELRSVFLHDTAAFYIPIAGLIDPYTSKRLCTVLNRYSGFSGRDISPPTRSVFRPWKMKDNLSKAPADKDKISRSATKGNADGGGMATIDWCRIPLSDLVSAKDCDMSPAAGGVGAVSDREKSQMQRGNCAPASTAKLYREASELLSSLSLNNIRVQVGGIMSVDVDTIPASIDRVEFENDKADTDPRKVWQTTEDQYGTIFGKFLFGGKPEIVDEEGRAATDWVETIETVAAQSTDTALSFKMKLKKKLDSSTPQLYLRVTKADKEGTAATSRDYILNLGHPAATPAK